MDFFQGSTPTWYGLAILLLPLMAFCFNAFTFRWGFTQRNGHVVPLLAIGTALFLAFSIFRHAVLGVHQPDGHEVWSYVSGDHGLNWTVISTGTFEVIGNIFIDHLTAIMLFVVTLVSFLVHLYSIGYMHGDKRFPRFFAFLGLFTFSMLGLIMVDDLLLLFCFWELVGLCSYFLIGFWYDQETPPKASMKAFLTNRFGDVGFLLGIFLCTQLFGTTSIPGIYEKIQTDGFLDTLTSYSGWLEPKSLLTLTGLLLFCGPMAKSAQVPMHIWLPDAMAGPTPVSALIHAATMVAAGVYMVGRIFFMFTPEALGFIAGIGAITALIAATIGLVHNNIKKVLAYSTCSQLGYMVMAMGVGGYSAGLYHLYTHAFFKACLFLGAGSVIHSVHTEDMREMGGLKNKMPVTFWTFMIATLALAGVPFFSGAFSKEMIIEYCIEYGMHGGVAHWVPAIVGVVGAMLTAFYMARLVYLTFYGTPRNQEKYDHAHESPATMTIPLMVLAFLSVFSIGWLPLPFIGGHHMPHVLKPPQPVVAQLFDSEFHHAGHAPTWLIVTVFAVSVASLFVAFTFFRRTYVKRAPGPEVWTRRFPGVTWMLNGLYFFDEFYQATVIRLGNLVSKGLAVFDQYVVDGLVNAVGMAGQLLGQVHALFDKLVVDGAVDLWWHLSHFFSRRLRRLQTGNLQDYLGFAVTGVLFVSVMYLFL